MAKKNTKTPTLKIGTTTYTFSSGFGFLNKIGILPKKTEENVDKLGNLMVSLEVHDPTALGDIAIAALATEENLSEDEISAAVYDNYMPEMFDEYDAFLDQSPLGLMKKQVSQDLEKMMNRLEAEETEEESPMMK